jgi:hypothetical protein
VRAFIASRNLAQDRLVIDPFKRKRHRAAQKKTPGAFAPG